MATHMRTLCWTVWLVLCLAACGSDPASPGDGGGLPGDDGATEADGGEPACTSTDDCAGALVCVDGVCQREGCTLGTEGCGCARGERCARGADGSPLACMAGVCSSLTCPTGTTGCACLDGESCGSSTDVCTGGYCVSTECLPGTANCTCLGGGCDANLHCLDSAICVDAAGYEGGACLPTGRCHASARCNAVLDICVYCEPGTEGCSCSGAGTCGSGLACDAGLCISESALPPASPECFTPCNAPLVTDGVRRTCDPDGLMAGCIGGDTCVRGSCVAAGASPPTCTSDLECPSHQACLLGGCYSNCNDSTDCATGLACSRHVCRVPCQSLAGSDPCARGTFCDTHDGENGYCMPMGPSGGTGSASPVGAQGFSVDVASLAFSNVQTSRTLTVRAQDTERRSHEFTVRRLSHVVTRRDGTTETVVAERDRSTGALLACDAVAGACPMAWLDIAPPSMGPSRAPEVRVSAVGECAATDACPELTIANADGVDASRWQGVLEISGNGGTTTVTVTYVEKPEGEWVGTMQYFAGFPTGGLSTWAARADRSNVTGVQNGLVAAWGAFRQGSLSGGWNEMKAVLTSTETGSWQTGSVKRKCRNDLGACYPYTNASGVRSYVTSLAATPIPTATTELPFALALRQPGARATSLTGRITSTGSLHYPGNPAVTLELSADPASATACSPLIGGDCVVALSSLVTESVVGGRYLSADGSCASGFNPMTTPWLVEGFTEGSWQDDTGARFRTWCVDGQLPYGAETPAAVAANRVLAEANPVPDGVARRRTLRLLDGALINQTEMFFFFQEEIAGFAGAGPVTSYGYVLLHRQLHPVDVDDDNANGIPDLYEGVTPPVVTRVPPVRDGARCDASLVQNLVGVRTADPSTLTDTNLQSLVDRLLKGTGAGLGSVIPASQVHYYCEDTGMFDGGPEDNGGFSPVRIACPEGSRVTYFSTDSRSQAAIAAEACQRTPSATRPDAMNCQETLNTWRENGIVTVYAPYYQCAAVAGTVPPYCDDDRLNLRTGKIFYRPAPSVGRTYDPLQASIDAAFRYRTRFTSSSGSRVGFAPRVCIPGSDQIPYCYAPEVIEEIRARIDCLLAVYRDDRAAVGSFTRLGTVARASEVQAFLRGSFAEFPSSLVGTTVTRARDGFERLYAELLVMQGDEALTQAFMSRFDLAGVGGAAFQGSLLEPGGVDLSGVAGFEMVALYRAVQHYQLALDRLYGLGPDFAETLSRSPDSVDSPLVFLSAETVVLHLERLIRASTQRARAYSEIALRYQRLNEPALSRSVIQRAYEAAFLESGVIVQLMNEIARRSVNADRPQIDDTIQQALRRYRMTLLDMRDLFGTLIDDVNYFGFEPDFIPFPPLDGSARGRNAFEVTLEIAQARSSFARMREDQALASNRSFQTDAAQFQAELVRLRNTYEAQLGELCGTFVSEIDGRVYPAIRSYASQSRYPELLGDPCGRLGNGQIHNALVEVSQTADLQRANSVQLSNIFEQVRLEKESAEQQCDQILDVAMYQYTRAGVVTNLAADMQAARNEQELLSVGINGVADLAKGLACIPNTSPTGDFGLGCVNEAIDGAIGALAAEANFFNAALHQDEIADIQSQLDQSERTTARWVTAAQCDAIDIQSNQRMASLLLGVQEVRLEGRRARRTSQLAVAEVGRLFNEAQRRQLELEESRGLLVDIESARNDPNVRVYRNDAVLNADIAFKDAIRMAYRATRVFEYYTSQTYPRWEQLFLIRMVGAGEYNLENYLLELQNAMIAFEETYGSPDTRVLVLSLMNDILQIPEKGTDGVDLTTTERLTLLHESMQDVDRLDANGYLTMSFGTSAAQLSPLTRNHKILYVESEIVGVGGDSVGRVYLRPKGTGVIRGLDDRDDFYIFPQRTAVVNTFFNGNRLSFSSDVTQNSRLRDQPLINTSWDLVFNQRDEVVNQDIDLNALTDIKVYIYYQDFTPL